MLVSLLVDLNQSQETVEGFQLVCRAIEGDMSEANTGILEAGEELTKQ